ncbi:MAG: peptidylprolyl isomerase, partial [Planctomycetota bacterium]
MRRYLYMIASAALLCLGASLAAEGEPGSPEDGNSSSRVLVEVNGEQIEESELDRYITFLSTSRRTGALQQGQGPTRPSRKQALKTLIERRLLVQAARDEFFGQENAEDALAEFGKRQMEDLEDRLGSPITVRQFLRSQNISREEFMKLRRNTILIREYLRQKVEKTVYVSPWRIKQYYRENQEEFERQQTVTFRQLWIDSGGEAGRQQAERILQEIRSGASFAEMVRKYGSASSRHPGGLHTVEGEGKLRGWLTEVLKSLEPGDVSEVQDTPIGYCIVKLEKWQEPG